MGEDNVIPIRPSKVNARVGGPIDKMRVTLGIHGEDLDPDEVSALLKCSPTSSHRRGDPRLRNVPPWPRGVWLVSLEGEAPTDPEELLNTLLARLPEDPMIWEGIRRRFTVQVGFGLFLDAWNRGFELSAEVLERVAKIGAPLGFDIYAEGYEGDG